MLNQTYTCSCSHSLFLIALSFLVCGLFISISKLFVKSIPFFMFCILIMTSNSSVWHSWLMAYVSFSMTKKKFLKGWKVNFFFWCLPSEWIDIFLSSKVFEMSATHTHTHAINSRNLPSRRITWMSISVHTCTPQFRI